MAKCQEKRGRPSKKTKERVTKLEEAFMYGFNLSEACLYAGISRETYYRWCESDAEFRDRMELLQSSVAMQARICIANNIKEGDKDLAKWYLERKCKDEFSTSQNVNMSGDIGIEIEIDYGEDKGQGTGE